MSIVESQEFEYLELIHLSHQFDRLSENVTQNYEPLNQIAIQSLQLMDKYRALSPDFDKYIRYLKSQHPNETELWTKYDSKWAKLITKENEISINKVEKEVKEVSNSSSPPPTAEDSVEQLQSFALSDIHEDDVNSSNNQIFNNFKRALQINIIGHNFSDNIYLINTYLTINTIKSHPKDLKQIIDNRYFELLFFQYYNNLNEYQSVSKTTNDGYKNPHNHATTLNILNSTYSKANLYYTKVEPIIFKSLKNGIKLPLEVYYYYLIKFYYLAGLFKELRLHKFNEEFLSLLLNSDGGLSNNDTNYSLQLLLSLKSLKVYLFSMYGLASIFTKPFKSLSYINNETVMDILTIEETGFDYRLYNEVLLPLSKSNFKQAHESLSNPQFILQATSMLYYSLPTNKRSSTSTGFFQHINKIIDLKSFLLIISMTKQISRSKLFNILGHDIKDGADVDSLTSNLLSLIAVLGLGKLGIGYKIEEEMFYNNEENHVEDELQVKLNKVTNDIYGDSMATLMKGLLMEKFFS
ncbi:uncharacterized protein RJT21DRAFT_9878 [Scheffersomyces amazonensis]|uniref:uncharacterized protein n=1 Tax=Scheffersomyces amazonensis TaxID=1078765 RepID=UPI00315CB601